MTYTLTQDATRKGVKTVAVFVPAVIAGIKARTGLNHMNDAPFERTHDALQALNNQYATTRETHGDSLTITNQTDAYTVQILVNGVEITDTDYRIKTDNTHLIAANTKAFANLKSSDHGHIVSDAGGVIAMVMVAAGLAAVGSKLKILDQWLNTASDTLYNKLPDRLRTSAPHNTL